MSLLSTCYGPDIEALADLDGGFEALSTDALLEFALRQWKDVAATLGFHAALARSVGAVQQIRGGLVGLHSTALAAFEVWHKELKRPPSKLPEAVRLARAKVRQGVLTGYAESRPERRWTLDEPAQNGFVVTEGLLAFDGARTVPLRSRNHCHFVGDRCLPPKS